MAALAAGAALAVAVASAGADVATTATITAKDYSFDNGTGGHDVTIAMGGTVSFGYPTGGSTHNVEFGGTPPSCTDMPEEPTAPGWSGSCNFDTPGTYAFHCGLHSFMTGNVEVVDPNAPTTGTTGPSPTDTGGSPTDTNPPPGYGYPGGGESSPATVKVARRQQGTVVHGSVTTPSGPSRIVVRAFAARSALASKRGRRVRIGSVTKSSKGTGATAFALKVNRAARRALHRRNRLTVSLRIVITPVAGSAVTKTKSVVLRERP